MWTAPFPGLDPGLCKSGEGRQASKEHICIGFLSAPGCDLSGRVELLLSGLHLSNGRWPGIRSGMNLGLEVE